jgi:hypothetical protein
LNDKNRKRKVKIILGNKKIDDLILDKRENGRTRRETRQQQSTQHQDNPAIKILEQEPGKEFIDDDNVHLVMNNRSLEFELQITKKFLSETLISNGVKQTCLKCDICHQSKL